MASKSEQRRRQDRRNGCKTVRPSKPLNPWEENTEMVSDTALARERLATIPVLGVEWVRCNDGKERKISGNITVRFSRAADLALKGKITIRQAIAAQVIILADEARNRTGGSAIPDLRVDGGGADPEWSLLRKVSGQNPMKWIRRQSQKQAVHAVLFHGLGIDRHIDELRKALDIVAEHIQA